MTLVDNELASPRFITECTPTYIELIHDFIFSKVALKLAEFRQCRGVFGGLKAEELDDNTGLYLEASGEPFR